MDIQTVLLAVIPAVISIAVSWGIIRTEVATMKEQMKETVNKEHCAMKHQYTDRDLIEMKATLQELKKEVKENNRLLAELLGRRKGDDDE